MKYERLKSYTLALLIASSLILSAYLWFSEELWPSGYNFFTSIRKNPVIMSIFRIEEPYSIPKENLSKPQKIVVTNGSYRYVYYNTDKNFDRIFGAAKNFLTEFFVNPTIISHSETVPGDEWYNVLRNDELVDTRSVYIDYSLSFTPSLFARVIGIKNTWLGQEHIAVKEFIIAPLDETGEDMIFYIRDSKTDLVKKYYVKYNDKESVYSDIINAQTNDSSGFLFSFELNLDKSTPGVGSGVAQNVFLNSLVLISPYPQQAGIIESENPLNDGGERSALLSTFNYNPASLNKHTDSAMVKHYVDNYSTLKIYPNGLLEYTALDASRGIKISDSSQSVYEVLNSAIEFAEGVWHSIIPNRPFDVLVTSNLESSEADDGSLNFTLDYYFEGTPVTVNLENSESVMNNAVEITIKSGVITKYRHLIRSFNKSDEVLELGTLVDVLDSIYNTPAGDDGEFRIEDIYITYKENGIPSLMEPIWCVKVAGQQDLVFYKPQN